MLTLAEELVLLAFTEKGEVASGAAIRLEHGIAGAQLMELALAGRVRLTADEKVVVADAAATGDPATDATLATVEAIAPPRTAQEWITQLAGAGPRTPVLAGLHERGVLSEQRGKVLGLFPRTRQLESDPEPEREVRARLRAAVLEPAGGLDPRTAALAALVVATELVAEVFPDEDEHDRAKPRLDALSRGDALRGAVGAANDALIAAMMAAVTTAVAASIASTTAVVVVTVR